MRVRRSVLAALTMVLVVNAAACGSSGSRTSAAKKPADAAAPTQSTELGTGVTADTIKIGVSLSDFDCIKPFVDNIRLEQEKNYQTFIDDVNAKGGVNGKKIVAVFDKWCPIPDQQRFAQVCTKFTEDEKVFAVIGNVFDPSGTAQTCIAKQHHTVLFAYSQTRAIMDRVPGGMLISPGNVPERTDNVLTQLLQQNHTLDGKKVGVLGEPGSQKTVNQSILPDLHKLGVQMGSVAVLGIAGSDTTSAQSQLDSFIERWKSEGTNALWLTGLQSSSKQFVEKIRAAMPDVILVTDEDSVLGYGQDETAAGKKPNPYEGILFAGGMSDAEFIKSENWTYCADIWKQRTGQEPPNRLTVIPLPGGKFNDQGRAIEDACEMVTLFTTIATKVGQFLNNENWVQTVDNYGPIVHRGGYPYASLGKGKYDIDDSFRLEEFDSSIPPKGDWKPITELQNITGTS